MIALRWLLIFTITLVSLLPNLTAFSSEVSAESKSAQSTLRRPAQNREEGYRMLATAIAEFDADKTIGQQRESMTRYNYYDRFWLALGWDMDNYHQSRLADQNVIHEKYVYLIKSGRFIDSLLIADDQVLMVEAKSARRELNNPDYIFQTKRYGWASPVADVAALTNFRDFRAYDTRLKPNYFKPEEGEIMRFRLHYTDYLKNFDALWDTFSYESVKKGSLKIMLDKIDPALTKKTLDMEIVNDFNDLRILLANDIVRNNPEISEESLNQSVQGLLNRLLLVRILEDRDIEPTKILLMTMLDWGGDAFVWDGISGAPQRPTTLYAAITKTITDRLYKKYRTPLFAAQPENRLKVSDEAIRKIILRLYPADSKNGIGCPYDFALVPTHILGTLYENFLGKRLILKNGRVIMESRPSVRETGGVYYTEGKIASFLAAKTITPLLKGKTPDEIYSMKFIDPASGCGAIIIQAYRTLENHVEAYYRQNPDKIQMVDSEFPDAVIHEGGRIQLSPYVKVKIAKTLYGVDIDPKAVEIAVVSVYIDILRDETFAIIDREQGYKIPNRSRKVDPRKFSLPDLTGNFVGANALIEPNYTSDDAEAVRPFDWRGKHRIGNIMNAGGFDAVIGNPPYLGYEKMNALIPQQLAYLRKQYTSMSRGKSDLSYAFVERGMQLLKPQGRLGYILTNRFLFNEAARPLRMELASSGMLDEVIDFTGNRLFQSAGVQTAMLFLQKNDRANATMIKVKKSEALDELYSSEPERETETDSYFLSLVKKDQLASGTWNVPRPGSRNNISLLLQNKKTLKDVAHCFSGIHTGADKVMIVTAVKAEDKNLLVNSKAATEPFLIESDMLRPLSREKYVERYSAMSIKEYVIFPYGSDHKLLPEEELKSKYPLAYEYLLQHQDVLKKRKLKTAWYEFNSIPLLRLVDKPKLFTSLGGKIGIDPDGQFVMKQGLRGAGIVMKDSDISLWMVMGLLQSKAVAEYVESYSSSFGNQYAYTATVLNRIPVPEYNSQTAPLYKDLEKLVKTIYERKQQKATANTAELEAELEALVLKLYEAGGKQAKAAKEAAFRVSPPFAYQSALALS